MNKNKDYRLGVRLSSQDKENIENYCALHNMKISEFVRMSIYEILNKKET